MSYTAVITREGDMWLAEVPGLPGAHAYARTLTRLREELTNAIILAAELDDDADPELSFEPNVGNTNTLLVRAFAVAEQRRELRKTEIAVMNETASLAKALIKAGWSVRDAAGALNVTPGRISQLVNSRG